MVVIILALVAFMAMGHSYNEGVRTGYAAGYAERQAELEGR
jgi:hypothetical protein